MSALIDTEAIISKQMTQEIFEQYDDDDGGSLDHDEIQTLFRSNKLFQLLVRKEDIQGLIKDIDKNEDGNIDFDEFGDMV